MIDISDLGTVLGVWAHPDDETFLTAGLMALARAGGYRVVCATATRGEHGTDDPDRWPPARLGRLREYELAAALAALDVQGKPRRAERIAEHSEARRQPRRRTHGGKPQAGRWPAADGVRGDGYGRLCSAQLRRSARNSPRGIFAKTAST
jgi:hypothetical protein